MWTALYVVLGLLALVAVWDLTQRRHAILRNFPILGHFRYLLEGIGPELRQYIVTSNDEERPFSRDERSWIYASSKGQNNYFGFGTDSDLELQSNWLVLEHAAFPAREPLPDAPDYDPKYRIPCAKVLGAARGRRQAFRPPSILTVSAMSYGSLGDRAVEALDRGCAEAEVLHNTGEGGISPHHDHGAGLIWQLGTGYFGARDANGRFDLARLVDACARYRVRAVEVKLSQGAKPGRGGVLPGEKVTPEIARIRGIPEGRDCLSPSTHAEFSCPDSLLDFVERIAEATGLPVGIKSAVGEERFWQQLTELMQRTERGVDYVQVDGGEGGTGAAPLVFTDHVALPFKLGFTRVYRTFAEAGLTDDVVFVGSGRLGLPENALLAMALGCDQIAIAREAMISIGCIQAQRCHTGHCPAGVATTNRWLQRGLDPELKAERFATYAKILQKELLWLARAAGHSHPALVRADQFRVLNAEFGARSAAETFDYRQGWGLPPAGEREVLEGWVSGPWPTAAAATR
ncbi:MAG: FMN-binding glutamate synthase family protein [Planctomycetota bacterium]